MAIGLAQRAMQARAEAQPKSTAADPKHRDRRPQPCRVFRAIGRLSRSAVIGIDPGESGSGKLKHKAPHDHSPRLRAIRGLNMAAIRKT